MSSIQNEIGYVVNNISLPFDASFEEAFSVARARIGKLGIFGKDLKFSIFRRSVDARKKGAIKFVYSIRVGGRLPVIDESRLSKLGISVDSYSAPIIERGDMTARFGPVVVGSGPCGLFCALLLAENGLRPTLIDRGGSIRERRAAVDKFNTDRILDTDCNIQFGAGGAGTFSDGKLVTRINDSLCGYVLERLIDHGAPEDIRYIAKPHIGTDVLSLVVESILERISALGGRVLYHTTLTGYKSSSGRITAACTNHGDIPCDDLVLAVGHSARDTYDYLISNGLSIEAKSFSVGMRIEHPTSLIDTALYGEDAGNPILGHAEYNLAYNTRERGVYTFCMCPGGVVVAATSENGGVVTNGMSYHARDGRNSNSAILCSIFKEDFADDPRRAISFQQSIERAAFVAGGSDYSAPIITVGDFLAGTLSAELTDVVPTYMDGKGVRLARPEAFLPKTVTDGLKNGILDFDRKIKGFASSSAVLTGAETRTSAPLRILRNNNCGLALGFDNLYPAGEGAGYAGGITSAAIDGIKTALHILRKYKA